MKKCKKIKKNIILALLENKDIEKSTEEHLKECEKCKEFYNELKRIDSISEIVKERIEREMERVDWERVERKIINKIEEESRKTSRIFSFSNLFSPGYLIPGIIILAIFSFFIYKVQISKEKESDYNPELMVEKIERISARNEILEYFEESALLLTSLREKEMLDKHSIEKSRELVLKKRFINQYLQEFPNARQIASKIDFIFMESQTKSEKREISKIIDDEKLLLKVKLIKEELKEMRL